MDERPRQDDRADCDARERVAEDASPAIHGAERNGCLRVHGDLVV
jgi:hypothetical protein